MAIIKYYHSEIEQGEVCSIIENANNVKVHTATFILPEGERPDDYGPKPSVPLLYMANEESYGNREVKYIDFTNYSGERVRLEVHGTAYVCSNEGKTIETVAPRRI